MAHDHFHLSHDLPETIRDALVEVLIERMERFNAQVHAEKDERTMRLITTAQHARLLIDACAAIGIEYDTRFCLTSFCGTCYNSDWDSHGCVPCRRAAICVGCSRKTQRPVHGLCELCLLAPEKTGKVSEQGIKGEGNLPAAAERTRRIVCTVDAGLKEFTTPAPAC
jgi:hypothetical protein